MHEPSAHKAMLPPAKGFPPQPGPAQRVSFRPDTPGGSGNCNSHRDFHGRENQGPSNKAPSKKQERSSWVGYARGHHYLSVRPNHAGWAIPAHRWDTRRLQGGQNCRQTSALGAANQGRVLGHAPLSPETVSGATPGSAPVLKRKVKPDLDFLFKADLESALDGC